MSLRDDLLPLLAECRAIPGELGLRPFSVDIRIGAWNGTSTGRGAEGVDYLPITEADGQNPKVRWLNGEQIALGELAKGAITIGPITPEFPGGGTAMAALGDQLARGETLHLLLTGPGTKECGDLYTLKDARADRALHYTLTAEPVQ